MSDLRAFDAALDAVLVDRRAEDLTRDPAEEACYDIQKACWQFQTAIDRCDSEARLAFIDGMLAESRKRVELIIVAVGSKTAALKFEREKGLAHP